MKTITIRKTSSEFGNNEFLEIDGKQLMFTGGTKKQNAFAKSLVDESITRDFLKIQSYIESNKKREIAGKPLKNVAEFEIKLNEKIERLAKKSSVDILENQNWL